MGTNNLLIKVVVIIQKCKVSPIIQLAEPENTNEVLSFFEENIDIHSEGIYNQEFICPDGVIAAIRRKQILVAKKEEYIIGALRYYKKKTDNSISLYQFAVDNSYRKQGLLKKMLFYIKTGPIQVKCPKHSSFNAFFLKTGWTFEKTQGELNCWKL